MSGAGCKIVGIINQSIDCISQEASSKDGRYPRVLFNLGCMLVELVNEKGGGHFALALQTCN